MSQPHNRAPVARRGRLLALSGAMVALVLVSTVGGVPRPASAAGAAESWIVYYSKTSPAGPWPINGDGSSPTPFKAGADGATFSADGTKMAYQVGGSVACNVNFDQVAAWVGLVATLLEAEDFRPFGLGAEAYATTVSKEASPYFTEHILDGLGNINVPGFPKGRPQRDPVDGRRGSERSAKAGRHCVRHPPGDDRPEGLRDLALR